MCTQSQGVHWQAVPACVHSAFVRMTALGIGSNICPFDCRSDTPHHVHALPTALRKTSSVSDKAELCGSRTFRMSRENGMPTATLS